MPELPEVEITMRGIASLVGCSVASVKIRNSNLRWPIPDHLPETLQNKQLLALNRRAKYILAKFENGFLILHLGMSGRICLLDNAQEAEKHDHFDIQFNDDRVLRFRDPRRFGAVLWTSGVPDDHRLFQSLGPEPLSEEFNEEYLKKKLNGHTTAIKNTIMDSHVVVGVGNIYANESLFRSRLDPRISASKLSRIQTTRLVNEIKDTLIEAIQAGGSSLRDFFGADGNPGYFQQEYFVYGRVGQACKICATEIQVIKQGQRSTFYCPSCQN